jgi:lipopolysaccharide transport system ATP-binding protein
MSAVIQFDQISKRYRLGHIGTGTLAHDLHQLWARVLGRDDPFAGVGDAIDRAPASAPPSSRSSRFSLRSFAPQAGSYLLALKNVSLEVAQGEVLGVIGRNGAGKSTLLKLLARVTAPSSGRIRAKGRIASLLEVGTGFHPELTGRENIFLNGSILGMSRRDTQQQLDAIVEFSGCSRYLDTPVKRYSSGMTARLGFAVAAHLQCDILVVDEVLAVGDADFQRRCIGRMRSVSRDGRTVLFVSHNMGSISSLCDRCLVLDNGTIDFLGQTPQAVQQYMLINSAPRVDLKVDPSCDFQFNSVSICDAAGASASTIPYDHPVTIKLEHTLKHYITGLELTLRVLTSHGMIVFTTHRSHTIETPIAPGHRFTSVTIPSNFLTPGDYAVELAAQIPNQRLLDLRKHAIAFRVEETGSRFAQFAMSNYGAVFCPCRWTDVQHATPA